MRIDNGADWEQSDTDIFWGEISPCDHVVQIYENDNIFLDALSGFAVGGINSGDCVIIIATKGHLGALESRLSLFGIDVDALIEKDQYIPLDAEETLAKFMVNGWPNEERFMKTVSGLLKRGHNSSRRVRAFGEMVALLWAKGHSGATIHLEHLWNKFCEKAAFCLFCAYPKSGFTEDMNTSIVHICGTHSRIINGTSSTPAEVRYQTVD